MNHFKKYISIFVFALIMPFCIKAQQLTREELNKQKQQIQKEIDDLNKSLNSVQNNKSSVLKTMSYLNNKIDARERLINNINKDLRRLDDDMYLKQIEIYRLKRQLDTLKKKYKQSIIYAYKNQNNYQFLNFLFSAKSFNDALKRISYLKGYRKMREDEANTIAKTQTDLQKNIDQLNVSKLDKKSALVSQNEQLVVLEKDKQEKDKVVKQLRGQEKEINAQLSKREKQRREINNAISAAIKRETIEAEKREKERLAKIKAEEDVKRKRLEAEAATAKLAADKAKAEMDAKVKADATDKLAAEEKAKKTAETAKKAQEISNNYNTETSSKTIVTPDGKVRDYSVFEGTAEGLKLSIDFESNRGHLPWPVNSGTICGKYGIEHLSRTITVERDGLFICLPVGATVKSVADGVVSSVQSLDEYNFVTVRHGKYVTVYNRLSEVLVTKGQKINAGTLIGRAAVGDGGEGEFEFRVLNGSSKFVNPEIWLKSR